MTLEAHIAPNPAREAEAGQQEGFTNLEARLARLNPEKGAEKVAALKNVLSQAIMATETLLEHKK